MSKSKNKKKMAVKAGINIGGMAATANPRTVEETAKSVVKVLEAGHKYRADQSTIVHALNVVKESAAATAHGAYGTTISGSNISTGQ